MNANELADMLAKSSIRKVSQGEVVVDMFEIADMLRQQQAEIDMLKKLLDDFGISVNRKPAKYSDEWWKEVEEFNKQLRAQKND